MSNREEFNCGEDSDGLWYVAIGNEQIVWNLSSSQAERVCAQLKAYDARYQARIKDLVTKAMRSSWSLGQTYWQQANSLSYSQSQRSIETQEKFEQLIEELRAQLAELGE